MNNYIKELKVEYEPTDSLIEYENNANIHTDQQIEQIANSIKEFGFSDVILVWTNSDGRSEIIAGHGRLYAAKKLGIDKVPVIHLDGLSDEARRAYTHTHNQLTRNSKFDFATLDEELANLNFDFNELGFNVDLEEPDFGDFFEESESEPKPGKEITCPACGETFIA